MFQAYRLHGHLLAFQGEEAVQPSRHRDDQRGGSACLCPDPGAVVEAGGRLLVLCLDCEHRRQLDSCPALPLRTVECPLQILRALDQGHSGPVLIDACPASLSCCRKVLPQAKARVWLKTHSVEIARPTEQRLATAHAELPTGTPGLPTVKSTAARLGVNSRRLARVFSAAGWGAPFREIRRRHLERALEELRSTNLSLQVIADRLGYHDAATFARAFMRAFGCYHGQARKPGAHGKHGFVGQYGHR